MDALAWRLDSPGGRLALERVSSAPPEAGQVRVRMQAVPLLGYLGAFIRGELPYHYPPGPFTPGTNGIGVVESVGADVHHLRAGQRVLVHPHLIARELVAAPVQVLMGLTGSGPESAAMLERWRDGTLAEVVTAPAANLLPLDGLDALSAERLAALGKFTVPLGGLHRGGLIAGETLIVHGASGYFGSAAVLLGVALGAACVVAAGRDSAALATIAGAAGARVRAAVLTGDAAADARSLGEACDGARADMAFDMVGRAGDAAGTLACLRALRRGGRMVLMGSMGAPLSLDYGEVMRNDWQITGQFMYAPEALLRLPQLIRAGLLDLSAVRIQTFPFTELPAALEHAAAMRGLDCTVVRVSDTG